MIYEPAPEQEGEKLYPIPKRNFQYIFEYISLQGIKGIRILMTEQLGLFVITKVMLIINNGRCGLLIGIKEFGKSGILTEAFQFCYVRAWVSGASLADDTPQSFDIVYECLTPIRHKLKVLL